MVLKDADRLRVDGLLLKPRDYDWSEGFTEKWDVIQPYDPDDFDNDTECPKCEGVGEILNELEEWEECKNCEGIGEIHLDNEEKTGYYDFDDMECSNTPMMNYYYPLPGSCYDSDDAKKINDTCLCLVYFSESEEYGLALTGGGMDLSWDICKAYIALGCYPPVHFRLPNFAGMRRTERNERVINACVKGREIVKTWMDSDIHDLEHVRRSLLDPKDEKV